MKPRHAPPPHGSSLQACRDSNTKPRVGASSDPTHLFLASPLPAIDSRFFTWSTQGWQLTRGSSLGAHKDEAPGRQDCELRRVFELTIKQSVPIQLEVCTYQQIHLANVSQCLGVHCFQGSSRPSRQTPTTSMCSWPRLSVCYAYKSCTGRIMHRPNNLQRREWPAKLRRVGTSPGGMMQDVVLQAACAW
jgi:hypothetical protein